MEHMPPVTLGQWIPIWMTSYKLGTIKQTSYYQLELLERHIPDSLKMLPIAAIRPIQLQSFYNEFSKTASKSYMDKMRVMVNALFLTAVENGLCDRNPTDHLNVPRVAEKPREAFTVDETQRILDYIQTCDNSRISTAVMTLLLTGIRRGELLGLKWDDISKGNLTINRGVFLENRRPVTIENMAKTQSSLRTVPLVPELLYRIQAQPKTGEFIFGTSSGGIWHPRNFSRDYERFFARLKEVEPAMRFLPPHCCRHTFATLSMNFGNDIRVTQLLLGHTDIKTTSRYIHPDTDSMNRAVSALRSGLSQRK